MEKSIRGRVRLQYISQIIEDQGCNSYQELKRKAMIEKHGNYCKSITRLNNAEKEEKKEKKLNSIKYFAWLYYVKTCHSINLRVKRCVVF